MVRELTVKDAFVISPTQHHDQRGYFKEIYSIRNDDYPIRHWRQANHSFSLRNVVRGIHVSPYSKLVTCLTGGIYDVVVDVRPESATFMLWEAVWLLPGGSQVYVPSGCGHAFMAAQDSHVVYLQDGEYNAKTERIIHWRDPDLGIKWLKSDNYILSDKDANAPSLRN